MYLLSIKKSLTGKPIKQRIEDETTTLNLVRRAMLGIQSMEETSADLRAIDLMNKVKPGKAQVIENRANGHCLVIQCHN